MLSPLGTWPPFPFATTTNISVLGFQALKSQLPPEIPPQSIAFETRKVPPRYSVPWQAFALATTTNISVLGFQALKSQLPPEIPPQSIVFETRKVPPRYSVPW